jgi:hypothetical protein
MSPEEILAELRDIHLPAPIESHLPVTFTPEPFYVLVAVLAAMAFLWWRRRTVWRREAASELSAALAEDAPERRWRRLVNLLGKVARHRHAEPPPCAFLPPEKIGQAEIDALAAHIRALTRDRGPA